jgi:hypothetical protein
MLCFIAYARITDTSKLVDGNHTFIQKYKLNTGVDIKIELRKLQSKDKFQRQETVTG